jgi:hypothetical protein
VGGIDFNKARMRWVAQAVLALSPSPGGFTAPQLAEQVRRLSQQDDSQYGSRRAAYDLKKLRGKQIICRIGKTARYETIPQGARAMAALLVLRDKAIKPLLAAAQQHRRSRPPAEPRPSRHPLPSHSCEHARGFPRTGDCCMNGDNYFSRLRL